KHFYSSRCYRSPANCMVTLPRNQVVNIPGISNMYAFSKISDKENGDWVLAYLWDKYCHITPGYSGLIYNIQRNKVYIDIEKEKIMRKMFKS
ncbi:hypothetical protein, partial [Mucilaginibacter antarcticus]